MRYCSLVLLLIVAGSCFAQDKVFLKNGSQIRGKILEGSVGDTLLVGVGDSYLLVPGNLIEEIHSKSDSLSFGNQAYPRGGAVLIQPGFIIGSHSKADPFTVRPVFHIGYEYRFIPLINLGVSAGVQSYADFRVFPVTANYLAVFGRSSGGWVLFGSAGYGAAQKRNSSVGEYAVDGGFNNSFGFGWQQRTGRSWVRIATGYSSQTINETVTYSPGNYTARVRRMNRIAFFVTFVIH